jgi:phage protein D/phage baseplate assembly protein gpV
MFTLLIYDNGLQWVDDQNLLKLGAEVEIKINNEVLIKGEITSLEPDFTEEGNAVLLVRGYDKSHRLHHVRRTKTYLQIEDSSLASQIAGNVGLGSDVDTTSTTYEYVMQSNQTDMEFLRSRAMRIGYQVYVEDGKLCFKKYPVSAKGNPVELEWGRDLLHFRVRMVAGRQPKQVTVRGWDPDTKQAILGQANAPSSTENQGGITQAGGVAASQAFGSDGENVVVNSPVEVQGEADTLAKGLLDATHGNFIHAEGECTGNPRIKAGGVVDVQGVGTRFGGKYLVSSATHVYNVEAGYRTTFRITGQQPNTLLDLVDASNEEQHGRGLLQGIVPAIVTNVNDPDDLGRVKVQFPWLGDDVESTWARVSSLMGGADRGWMILPEVNDEVLVAFEHGDTRFPYVIGSLWSKKDNPPLPTSEAVSDGKVVQRILKTRAGHTILLDDSSGKEQVVIRDKNGNEILIDSSSNTITITADVLEEKVAQNATFDCQGDIKQNATNLTIKCKGNLNLEASGQLKIKGAQVAIEGSGSTQVKSSGILQIQGSVVKIN